MKAVKIALTLVLVTGAIWLAVVMAWQVNEVNPSGRDLVLYLGVLPAVLIGSFFLVRFGIRRQRERAQAEADAAAPANASTPATAAAVRVTETPARLRLHAVALHLAVGSDAAEAAQALVEPERPKLHPKLKDPSGMPVLAAPVDGVSGDDIVDSLRASARDADEVDRVFSPERLRALALLDPVAEQLLFGVLDSMPPPPVEEEALTPYGNRRTIATAAPPMVRGLLLLPASWPAPARQIAADWLLAKAASIGLGSSQVAIETLPVQDVGETWRLFDQLAQRLARDPSRDRHLLLACASEVGERAIDELAASGKLLVNGRPEGLVPGEGAAGLWLGAAEGAAAETFGDTPPLLLHPLRQGQVAAGTSPRNATRQSTELLNKALAAAARPAESVLAVVSDADQRPSRAIEIASAVAAVCPELDPATQCLNLGVACGHLGPVAPLAVIAIASAQVRKDQAPVLAVGLADGESRAALTLTPLPPAPVSGQPSLVKSEQAA